MNKREHPNTENYIKILSKYIPTPSMIKLKLSYETFNLEKYSKSTILENKNIKESFCILICGTIRHYTINNKIIEDTIEEEQTLRFTFPGNILYHHNNALSENIEYLHCISECTILSIPNKILKEIGEDVHIKNYNQKALIENLEFEVYLLRMPPEKRYKKLCQKYQNIFLLIPLKHIASFLGITPQALCRIRKRLLTT